MNTITEKSITLQLLEDLLFTLKKVLPGVHSPLGVSNMILVLLADIRFLYHRIKDLENVWELHLPFGEGDDKDVDWDVWKKDLHPERIRPFIENLGDRHEQMMEGDRYPYTENETMIPSRNMEYVADQETLKLFLKETKVNRCSLTRLTIGLKYLRPELEQALLAELKQLWDILDLTEQIISTPNDDKIKDFYEERKRIFEETNQDRNTFSFLDHKNRNREYYLRTILERMFKSKFIGVSVFTGVNMPDYMEKARNVWNGMLDGTGQPDILEIGRYIYWNRRKLQETDLEIFFEYMELYEYLKETEITVVCPKEETSKKKTSKPVPDHKVFHQKCGTPGIGKKINIKSLKKIIEEECLPEITKSYHWYCLYHILIYRGIVKEEVVQTDFIQKMKEWYPKHTPKCSKYSLHISAAFYFKANKDYETWNDENYRNATNGKIKGNQSVCKEMKNICRRMDSVVKGFSEHPDVEL